jgi:glycosyltransferase involved in cell wall biosynthesis
VQNIRYSIIITCHNQQAYIRDAVESVLLQMTHSKQVIVVDDGSQDGSLEILREYGNSVELVILPENGGVNAARNRGAAIARGEYLIFLDGDDLFTPWALEVYDRLVTDRLPVTIVSDALWFEGVVPISTKYELPRTIEFVDYEFLMNKDRKSNLYTGGFVINRLAFEHVGGWTPGIWHLDGHDLYAKLGYSGNTILVLRPYTMLYRMHDVNSIRSVAPYSRAAQLLIDRERGGQYPGGQNRRFQRYARLGGTIFFCIRRLSGAGLYSEALRLGVRGIPMILAAIMNKSLLLFMGRRPVQTLELSPKPSRFQETASRQKVG